MNVIWSDAADDDLDAIETFIEIDNPTAAYRIYEYILDTVALLEQQPMIGRVGRVARTRELVVPGTPYIVAYTINKLDIVILAVTHGARKWPDTLS